MGNDGSRNVIICGVGGQGNVTAARLLATATIQSGYTTAVGDVFGLTQRGGSVASHVRWVIGRQLPPLVPRQRLDILIGFEPLEAFRTLSQFGCKDTKAVVNDMAVMPLGVLQGRFAYPERTVLWKALRTYTSEIKSFNATKVAVELGNIQCMNMVMMGALFGSGFTEIDRKKFEIVLSSLPESPMRDINVKAFRKGYEIIQHQEIATS